MKEVEQNDISLSIKIKKRAEMCVDLRGYKKEITSAVRIGLGNKNVKVAVEKDILSVHQL
ncbi:MAG: hypothetical protein ACLUUG_06810 [Lachnospiraceae bacterium]